jgi:hypothetical protein
MFLLPRRGKPSPWAAAGLGAGGILPLFGGFPGDRSPSVLLGGDCTIRRSNRPVRGALRQGGHASSLGSAFRTDPHRRRFRPIRLRRVEYRSDHDDFRSLSHRRGIFFIGLCLGPGPFLRDQSAGRLSSRSAWLHRGARPFDANNRGVPTKFSEKATSSFGVSSLRQI